MTHAASNGRLEAEAVLGVLKHVDAGSVELISSTVLELEILRNPVSQRREFGEQILKRTKSAVSVDERIAARAAVFIEHGVKAMDALHLALAESAGVDYFCTCDERFLRRARSISDLRTVVISPLELIEVIEK
ncbi:MAG: PIN domain-containing protein [Caldilineaceae bacterium]|nr:PIN domain-containing protein [Caldilineaceae bacterium]